MADSLRTELHCFHRVQLNEPHMIRLRELSRLSPNSQRNPRHVNLGWSPHGVTEAA
jgi:hypothetical protein